MSTPYEIQRLHYSDSTEIDPARRLLEIEAQRKGHPLRYFIRTFGCQQNESDSEKLAGMLESLGFIQTDSYETADFVLINTCSIRENADQRLFGHLGELKALREKNKEFKVAVCGCLPTQEPQREKILQSFAFVNLIFGPQDLHRLPELVYEVYSGKKQLVAVNKTNVVCEDIPSKRSRSFRALVSIMYGCNNFCTYCVVPASRERERSREFTDILAEVKEVAAQGTPEVMLLGQNVNAWGFDLYPRPRRVKPAELNYSEQTLAELEAIRSGDYSSGINSFARLVTAIAGVPGIKSVRYMSPHPRDFDGEMLAALKVSPEIENHIHLPVQAGSDAVLKAMNRHYTRADYLRLVEALRQVRPGISITTDIMVGFPGETEQDFEDTLSLVEEVGFNSAFSFIYSARPHTPAAAMEQIDEDIKHERFDRLLELLNRLSLADHQSLVGTKRSILLEGLSKQDPWVLTGRDSEFHLINVPLEPGKLSPEMQDGDGLPNADYFEGRFMKVEITEAKTFSLEAKSLD